MTRFAAVLRRVEAHLTVPQPTRSRILHEMAADLEDLYDAYRARGLGEEEALRRAEAALGASEETVDALVDVHRPAWERLLGRFSASGRNRLERGLVSAMGLAAVLVGAAAFARQGILNNPSPFVWPVLVLTAGALVIAAGALFRLFVKQDHRRGTVRRGLLPLLVLTTAIALVAAFGAIWEIQAAIDAVIVRGAADPAVLLPHIRRAAEVVALALTSDLAVLLAWFHLRQRAQSIERAEASLPVAPSHPPTRGG